MLEICLNDSQLQGLGLMVLQVTGAKDRTYKGIAQSHAER